MATSESAFETPHDPELARFIWEEMVRVTKLHGELSYYYRTKSRDKRTIQALWDRIDEGEAGLRVLGVQL